MGGVSISQQRNSVSKEVGIHELNIHRSLSHPNIVRFIDSYQKDQSIYLEMEFCQGGCLLDLLNSRLNYRLNAVEVFEILFQTTSALDYVHSLGFIHRDIKIENVLISHDQMNNNVYKLCDFGSTTNKSIPYGSILTQNQISFTQNEIDKQTTPAYRAPELIDLHLRMGIDFKIDIWVKLTFDRSMIIKALGVLTYKLCYYTTPFENSGNLAILNGVYSTPTTPVYPVLIQQLISIPLILNSNNEQPANMLQVDPRQRPDTQTILSILKNNTQINTGVNQNSFRPSDIQQNSSTRVSSLNIRGQGPYHGINDYGQQKFTNTNTDSQTHNQGQVNTGQSYQTQNFQTSNKQSNIQNIINTNNLVGEKLPLQNHSSTQLRNNNQIGIQNNQSYTDNRINHRSNQNSQQDYQNLIQPPGIVSYLPSNLSNSNDRNDFNASMDTPQSNFTNMLLNTRRNELFTKEEKQDSNQQNQFMSRLLNTNNQHSNIENQSRNSIENNQVLSLNQNNTFNPHFQQRDHINGYSTIERNPNEYYNKDRVDLNDNNIPQTGDRRRVNQEMYSNYGQQNSRMNQSDTVLCHSNRDQQFNSLNQNRTLPNMGPNTSKSHSSHHVYQPSPQYFREQESNQIDINNQMSHQNQTHFNTTYELNQAAIINHHSTNFQQGHQNMNNWPSNMQGDNSQISHVEMNSNQNNQSHHQNRQMQGQTQRNPQVVNFVQLPKKSVIEKPNLSGFDPYVYSITNSLSYCNIPTKMLKVKPNLQLISRLRQATQMSMKKVSEALILTGNDFDKALLHLSNNSLSQKKLESLSERTTNQGLILVSGKTNSKVMIQMNCETDFVSRSAQFQALSQTILDSLYVCLDAIVPKDARSSINEIKVDSIQQVPVSPLHSNVQNEITTLPIMSINKLIHSQIAVTGENILIREIAVSSGSLSLCKGVIVGGSYVHGNNTLGVGRIGALLTLKAYNPPLKCVEAIEKFANKLAQHCVGMNPTDVNALFSQEYLFEDKLVGEVVLENELEFGKLEILDFKVMRVGL